ncbi:MAG: hypothetical protein ACR2PA_06715 [Hyphomicrobiaceae bacterium]
MTRPTQAAGESGMVLVAVLWIVALLSLLVSAHNTSVRTAVTVTSAEFALARLETIADAGIELAAAKLQAADADRWIADGRLYQVRFANAVMRLRIRDTNGLLNLNRADGPVMVAVLRALTSSERQAKQIHDHIISRREQAVARTARSATGVDANRTKASGNVRALALQDLNQLLDAPGVDLGLLQTLRRFVTVHSASKGINPDVAPRGLLRILPGVGEQQADTLMDARNTQTSGLSAETAQPASSNIFVSKEGPAFRVSIEVQDKQFKKPLATSAVIMIVDNARQPFHIISRQPFATSS